jgi:hypothetical protein
MKACETTHGLNSIVGYRVVQTIDEKGGSLLGLTEYDGQLVKEFEGDTSYAAALDVAKAVRQRDKAWAVVEFVYACGCAGR